MVAHRREGALGHRLLQVVPITQEGLLRQLRQLWLLLLWQGVSLWAPPGLLPNVLLLFVIRLL